MKRKRTANKTSIKLHDGIPASDPTGREAQKADRKQEQTWGAW